MENTELKLTKKEIKAVKNSIKHWERCDIVTGKQIGRAHV